MMKCPHCGKEFERPKAPKKPYSGYLKHKVDFIIESIKGGWTAREIALALGNARHQPTIYHIARSFDLHITPACPPHASDRNKTIYKQRKDGMTLRHIGKLHGLGPERVRQIVAREERATRNRS